MDITDRKRAEESLKTAKAQTELYLDLMGHDISNMNQIAMGFLELAIGSFHLDDEGRKFLEKPLEMLKNSAMLIENVRKLQKLEEGGLKYRDFDLCGVLQQVIDDYSHVPGREVTIHFKPLPICYVVANDLIKDVFSNLIGNAIKHSDPQQPITIEVRLEPVTKGGKTYYKVTVEDNGPGIPDELKNRLFMRFQRGQAKTIGKGLGLYLVRTLVHDFRGTIWVEDLVPGDYTKGAKFVVLLPAVT
jgi:signal transduction histidine kinase